VALSGSELSIASAAGVGGVPSAKQCARLGRSLPAQELESIQLRLGPHGYAIVRPLRRPLRDASQLRTLRFESCGLGRAAKPLLVALRANRTLTSLSLADNVLGHQPLALGLMVAAHPALARLNLRRCALGDPGIKAVADALAGHRTLTELDLADNGATDGAAVALADALSANDSLKALDLSASAVGDEGALALARALRANNARLALLALEGSEIELATDEAAVQFCDALRGALALRALRLGQTRIQSAGYKRLQQLAVDCADRLAIALALEPGPSSDAS
jgi:hypothetical protein